MTASCRICGRQCEASEDGRPLMSTCPCVKTPLGSFIRGAFADCVGPAAPEPPASPGPRPAVFANIRRSRRREEWD